MKFLLLLMLSSIGCACAQTSDDADYRLQLDEGASYRLYQPEAPRISEYARRQARRAALGTLPFAAQIEQAAEAGGIEPELLHAVVNAESAYNARAVSSRGALGLAQLMPETARDYGVADALRPADNLRASARHLRTLLDRFGRLDLVLSAYNAGAGTVTRYGGVPPYPETRAYVPRVSGRYEALKRLSTPVEPPPPESPYRLRADSAETRLVQSGL